MTQCSDLRVFAVVGILFPLLGRFIFVRHAPPANKQAKRPPCICRRRVSTTGVTTFTADGHNDGHNYDDDLKMATMDLRRRWRQRTTTTMVIMRRLFAATHVMTFVYARSGNQPINCHSQRASCLGGRSVVRSFLPSFVPSFVGNYFSRRQAVVGWLVGCLVWCTLESSQRVVFNLGRR